MPEPEVVHDRTTTIGVTGHRRRWSVGATGSVRPWSDAAGGDPAVGSLDWYVAADDRWHVPAEEPTVRQRRVEGTPVVETRLRVPEGDAIQRVWAVPEAGGVVIVEFENESPMPLAFAVHGDSIATERPASNTRAEGIDLPADTIVLPVGHHSTVRLAVGGWVDAAVPATAPWRAAVRGWTRVVEQASRFVLPDPSVAEAVVSSRCELLLEGPVGPELDPIGFLLDVGELVRCGDDADAWLVDAIAPAEALLGELRSGRRSSRFGRRRSAPVVDVEFVDALAATRRVAAVAGDTRAVGDLDAVLAALPVATPPEPVSLAELRRGGAVRDAGGGALPAESVGRFVRRVERRFALGGDLLPGGLPSAWLGADFEVHGLPTGVAGSVGFAVRWHGERPAVLWEQSGDPTTLTARSVDPEWRTDRRSGEALWAVPGNARLARRPISLSIEGVDPDGG